MSVGNNHLYIKIKENIIEDIKGLKPDERLPSRTALVNKYNVTRTTIDRAISELIGEGYLYSLDGSGTYVKANGKSNVVTVENDVANWGVILPNIMHDGYPGILRGVEDIANRNNINVVICNTDNHTTKQSNYIDKLVESGVKGLVIVPAIIGENDLNPFKKIQAKKIPMVFCNRGVSGIVSPKVIPSSFHGGYIATKHLIQMGYRIVAFISRPMYSASLDRYQGYLSALTEANIAINEDYVFFEEEFEIARPGYEATKVILQKRPRPDAIFCFNDIIAHGAYEAISEMGLKVGEDIGLMGYDDTSICEKTPVKLTSIRCQTYEVGSIAAQLLLDIMHTENVSPNKTVILQPELVIRDSCKQRTRDNN